MKESALVWFFYVLVGVLVVRVVLWVGVKASSSGALAPPEVEPELLAYLRGGPAGVLRMAISTLLHDGRVELRTGGVAAVGTVTPPGLTTLEQAVWNALHEKGVLDGAQLISELTAEFERIQERGMALRLVPSDAVIFWHRQIPSVLLLASMIAAGVLLVVSKGIVPFELAFVLMLLSIFMVYFRKAPRIRTTWLGDQVVANHVQQHEVLASHATSATGLAGLTWQDVALAAVLFPGAAAFADVNERLSLSALPGPSSGSWSSCASGSSCGGGGSDSGSGGCGSGGDGGGGCGGGGCGGCGGGGD